MLTVLTWLWRQRRGPGYTAAHVNIWADMVRRNLSMQHRVACVTEFPEGIDPSIEIIAPPGDFEDVTIPTWRGSKPQCLRRLAMFRPDAADIFGDRFACMDLDCVIAGPLAPLLDVDDDFVICPGTAPSRPYNGSMMLIRAGSRPDVYERFTAEGAAEAGRLFVGSDQAWISHILGPNERTFGGIHYWRLGGRPEDARVAFFPGQIKPWHLDRDPWVGKHYRRSPRSGRCLILGCAPTVWVEATAAFHDGRGFDAVIALPEAAAQWPEPVLAVASNDAEAERIAEMHGYSDIVFCGRSPRVA